MIRPSTDEDISDEELEKIINPFYNTYDEFIENYVMPEVIAYYIANSFYRNAMWEATFDQHYNSAKDIINLFGENYKKVKTEVIKLLRIKYALEIINDNPLELKKLSMSLNHILSLYSFYIIITFKLTFLFQKLTENLILCEYRWLVGGEKLFYS